MDGVDCGGSAAPSARRRPARPPTPPETRDLRLAIELSRQSFLDEQRSSLPSPRRSSSSDALCSPTGTSPSGSSDLIDLEDPRDKAVAAIKQLLYPALPSSTTWSAPVPPAVARLSSYDGLPKRNVSLPTLCNIYPRLTSKDDSNNTVAPPVVAARPLSRLSTEPSDDSGVLANTQPSNDVHWRKRPLDSLVVQYPLLVPFRPTTVRFADGDLIDFGSADADAKPAYEEFDPVVLRSASVNAFDSSGDESRASPSTLTKPAKPARRSRPALQLGFERLTEQVDVVRPSSPVPLVAQQTVGATLERRSNAVLRLFCLEESETTEPSEPWCRLMVSPRATFSLSATSAKVVVHRSGQCSLAASDAEHVAFICDLSSPAFQVLTTALYSLVAQPDDPQLNADRFGLKVYGADEYLLPQSALCEYSFVRRCVAFGHDIELQIDDLPTFQTQPADLVGKEPHFEHVACARYDAVQVYLDTILSEIARHANSSFSGARQSISQSVKALCVALGRLESTDLTAQLLRLRDGGERPSLCEELVAALWRQLDAYSRCSVCDFSVRLSDAATQVRDIADVEESLLLYIDSVQNFPAEWRHTYESFSLTAHVYHGSAPLCKWQRADATVRSRVHFEAIAFDCWLQFCLPVCVVPREANVLFVLYGRRGAADATDASTADRPHDSLGWTFCSVFDGDARLRQGDVFMPFYSDSAANVQPWGVQPHLRSTADIALLVTLPRRDYQLCFPNAIAAESRASRDFSSLDTETQQNLEDILDQRISTELTADEKELLWEKRDYLRSERHAGALDLVLASAVGWDWASLSNVYRLLVDWPSISATHAVQILQPQFADSQVRSYAVERLHGASVDQLFGCLPQLVEALRFDGPRSALAMLLLHLAKRNRRFAFELFWILEQQHAEPSMFGLHCAALQHSVVQSVGPSFSRDVERQVDFLAQLDQIAAAVKSAAKDSVRKRLLEEAMSRLDGALLANHVRLPLYPPFNASGVLVEQCGFAASLTTPLLVHLRNEFGSFGVLYKLGDDLRQDALVLQMVGMMNDIWLEHSLDLRMVVFKCMPTGPRRGLIELIRDSRTFCKIEGVTGCFKDDTIQKWLQTQNQSEFDYKIALENFRLSCAGWCVGTYVLGIGDRHSDNIMVTRRGHVFHIDFGKYLGDWQTAGGVRRDRVPFVLTSGMVNVINEGAAASTQCFQAFVDHCCTAFNLLRRRHALILNLMSLMVCSGIGGLDQGAVQYIRRQLWLDCSEAEATALFTRFINESVSSLFPKLNFFAHAVVQAKAGALLDDSDPDALSFVPQVFSEASAGRISSVQVLRCEKWRTSDKVYMYLMHVERCDERVPTSIYRSYAEFHEFYVKLRRKFPLANLHGLARGQTIVGRTNVRSVAERRLAEIRAFLQSVFAHSAEICRNSLVYTFFHPLLRDQQDADVRQPRRRAQSATVRGVVSGELKLTVSYRRGVLQVLVNHARSLSLLPGSVAPDAYVKCYLRPSSGRQMKRKTRIVKKSQNPTFNDLLLYHMTASALREMQLEASVWHSEPLKENQFLGAVVLPLQAIVCGEPVASSWFPLRNITC